MVCVVDANPIKDDTVKWSRAGFDDARMKTSPDGNSFHLTVLNVTEKDAGEFTCTVKNGIGNEVNNKTFLLVKRKNLFNFFITVANTFCLYFLLAYPYYYFSF